MMALNKIEIVSLKKKKRMDIMKASYSVCHEYKPAIERKEGRKERRRWKGREEKRKLVQERGWDKG